MSSVSDVSPTIISNLAEPKFITRNIASIIQKCVDTPAYVYDMKTLLQRVNDALGFPNAYGLTVRYAMKANPNSYILQILKENGILIDASSGYECSRAIRAGYLPKDISLSSQEFRKSWIDILKKGVTFNACSLHQIYLFGKAFPGGKLGLRFNPGVGSGGHTFTNVGGRGSSFGIWYELLPDVLQLVRKYDLHVFRIHTHIGSGSDPKIWQRVAQMTLDLVSNFPDITVVNLGGGFKVARMSHEKNTEVKIVGKFVYDCFKSFYKKTGRKLHLEIEPGTFLVANAGAVLASIQDIANTGPDGFTFLKLDTGMTEIMRPMLYGAEHQIKIINRNQSYSPKTCDYVIVGHCCETGDVLTVSGNDRTVIPRIFSTAKIGDFVVIEDAGAYCASMSTKNYNSYPEAPEIMIKLDGQLECIRRRQTLKEMTSREINSPLTSSL